MEPTTDCCLTYLEPTAAVCRMADQNLVRRQQHTPMAVATQGCTQHTATELALSAVTPCDGDAIARHDDAVVGAASNAHGCTVALHGLHMEGLSLLLYAVLKTNVAVCV